jgi:spermidine synthase
VEKLRYFEKIRPETEVVYTIREVIVRAKTPYQYLEIYDLYGLGISLFLDGWIQIAEVDEFIYHESLVHPSLLSHPDPRVICVGGGGDGGAIREILKHPTVERVVLIEIDPDVIAYSRRYLQKIHQGAFDDPRVEIVVGDARSALREFPHTFDVILLDLTEPHQFGPSQFLYTREFYEIVLSSLRSPGVFVTQCADSAPGFGKLLADVVATLKTITPYVRPYLAPVMTFQGLWSFSIAGMGVEPFRSLEEWEKRLKPFQGKLKWCTPQTLWGGFQIPPYLKEILQTGEVRTDAHPHFWKI